MKSRHNITLFIALKSLWSHISKHRKTQFYFLIFMTFIASLAEVISLGSVLPFIGVLTNPEAVYDQEWIKPFLQTFNISNPQGLILPLSIAFAILAIFSGLMRLLILWATIWISNATGADLGIKLYKTTINKSYEYHIENSSSEIIAAITQKIGASTSVLISASSVFTSLILFISITTTLLLADTLVAIIAGTSFIIFYGIIGYISSFRLKRNSIEIANLQSSVVKSLQEGIGGIKDLILNATHNYFIKQYSSSVNILKNKQTEIQFINQAPRYLMESLAMILIAIFVITISTQNGGLTEALPILAIMALGAQRLLPVMQQLYLNWSVLVGSFGAISDVVELLNEDTDEIDRDQKKLEFTQSIDLVNVSFRYSNSKLNVLEDVNISIKKGDRVGIIGQTGSGKSTLIDILSGLLTPIKGNVLVDNVNISQNLLGWRKNIAYVPQSIFLSDSSIFENIAFGVSINEINEKDVIHAANQAKITSFIDKDPQGLNKLVGERGVKLSGGQRQRIGIARALYKYADLIILDEATSALDNLTEKEVMREIDALDENLTVIIIAHRLSTLNGCNKIYEVKDLAVKLVETENLN